MNTVSRIFIFCLVFLTVSCSSPELAATTDTPAPSAVPSPTPAPESPGLPDVQAIVNGSIIDGTGAAPIPDGVLLIEDGLIVAIGSADDIQVPEGASVVDAKGGTILPGLVEAHSHVVNGIFVEDREITSARVMGFLSAPLKAGVTTILDFGSPWGITRDISDLRDALANEGNSLPNIALAGPILTVPDSPLLAFAPSVALQVEGVEDARSITKALIDQGVDLIKIYVGTVNGFSLDAETVVPSLTGEQIQAITQAAHEEEVQVFAHAVDEGVASLALANGVDGLAHWPGPRNLKLPDNLVQQLISGGIPVVTTFNWFDPDPGDVSLLVDGGVKFAMGSDSNAAFEQATLPFSEMNFMIEAGLTPMEVIMASTAYGAQVAGLGDQVGTLEVGKIADIIVVNGDPLLDFSVMQDVVIVIKGGSLVLSLVE